MRARVATVRLVRIALVHDWLTGLRGGERVLHELALLYPDADLYTLVHVPGSTTRAIEARHIESSPLSKLPGVAHYYRSLLPLFPWAIRRFDFSRYDLVISCSHAVAKGVRVGPQTAHLCYCLTPMRYIWDQAEAYLGRGARRRLAAPLVAYLRHFDRKTSGPSSVTRFVAISTVVRERIARHYQRDSSIVFPPVDVDAVQRVAGTADVRSGDFYLLVGGFVPYKLESLAIEAFRRSDRKLVIAGDGPTRRKLERSAPENVRFLGRIPDAELRSLYAECRALIYPQEEDFGIVAVEAQAAGRPVIAFGRGGSLDTVCSRKPAEWAGGSKPLATGVHFTPQTPGTLVAALEEFEAHPENFEPGHIREWSMRFGINRFRREFQGEVQKTLELHRGA